MALSKPTQRAPIGASGQTYPVWKESAMRKMYRRKRRSCGVCHPNKKGVTKRWSHRDEILILEFERERKRWIGREQS